MIVDNRGDDCIHKVYCWDYMGTHCLGIKHCENSTLRQRIGLEISNKISLRVFITGGYRVMSVQRVVDF